MDFGLPVLSSIVRHLPTGVFWAKAASGSRQSSRANAVLRMDPLPGASVCVGVYTASAPVRTGRRRCAIGPVRRPTGGQKESPALRRGFLRSYDSRSLLAALAEVPAAFQVEATAIRVEQVAVVRRAGETGVRGLVHVRIPVEHIRDHERQ